MKDGADIVARDAAVFIHQDGSSPCIGALRAAKGLWIEDVDGRRYIDLHGNSCHHLGHAHPRIIAALKDQLDQLAFSPRRFANAPAAELAERLTARFRGGRSRLLLMPGGCEAIETAIRLARIATGRSGIIALEGSYHGHGMGSLALSSGRLDSRLGSQLTDIHHLTPYWDQAGGGAEAMIADLAACLAQNRGRIACLVAEPIRSNAHVPPSDLWTRCAGLCAEQGVKLIFDEIPSGLGKTGRFFAHEHFGVTPDMVVLGKALGGGVLPLAAVIADDRLNLAPELSVGHFTHEKNPLLARAALAMLDVIEDGSLVAAAEIRGQQLEKLLDGQTASGLFLRLRGLGLLRALAFEGAPLGEALLERTALAVGLSATAKDDFSIGVSLPLISSDEEIRIVAERLHQMAENLAFLQDAHASAQPRKAHRPNNGQDPHHT
ncbi:aminotransferase class III-fold pyridoxal phosphate-dependent enzyme [Aestuariivirga sp.]|uniref:aminotransferase class III-fold pyridoxal phosphate-dependent enzyme n=1 Tax=Aestuariivirga sp. TaxID=2650926 RepID=UPI00378309F8